MGRTFFFFVWVLGMLRKVFGALGLSGLEKIRGSVRCSYIW